MHRVRSMPCFPTLDYLERPPEKLVLEGYRHWTRGYAARSMAPWTEAQRLYRGMLGDADGERAINALAGFVKTLGACAACPLKMFRSGAPFVCRDETLVMGLIAGIQNVDQQAVEFCLVTLCCPDTCDAVAMAAGHFALNLRAMDQVMTPIPVHVLSGLVETASDVETAASTNPTLH
ncbi:MAG: hypothetical protein NXI27_06130 [Alphaproteobacteria bacterium]|nr:hypothetical protein [Alphaproteobacteria bacterium]